MDKRSLLTIDFGTTNSVACLFCNGHSVPVTDDLTSGLTSFPSLVAYHKGKVITCNAAKEGRNKGRYKYVVSCVKRLIGLRYAQYLQLPDQSVFGCDVVKGPDDYPRFIVSDDGMQKDCVEVASEIFATIKSNAVRMNEGKEIEECYVTVPANYKDNQREAIKKAAKRAGLTVIGIIPEPTAAAMSWCFEHTNEIGIGEKMLVFDFGGGTLDISVIEYEGNGKFQVCKLDGDPRLGGSDVDMEVAKLVTKMVREKDESFDPLKNKKNRTRFLAACEEAKISLSSADEADVKDFSDSVDMDISVTREQLQDIFTKKLKKRIDDCLNRILTGPSLSRGVIKHVFLVGGSTRLVAVQNYMHDLFKCKFPTVNPVSCVAEGALAIVKAKNDPIHRHSVTEIIPFSYGLLGSDDKVVMLLNKGTQIPYYSGVVTFNTAEDYPRHIRSQIYQWDGRKMDGGITIIPVSECTFIDEYVFVNENPKPKGEQTLSIRFYLDVGGTLEVICKDYNSGKEMNRSVFKALIANGGK